MKMKSMRMKSNNNNNLTIMTKFNNKTILKITNLVNNIMKTTIKIAFSNKICHFLSNWRTMKFNKLVIKINNYRVYNKQVNNSNYKVIPVTFNKVIRTKVNNKIKNLTKNRNKTLITIAIKLLSFHLKTILLIIQKIIYKFLKMYLNIPKSNNNQNTL